MTVISRSRAQKVPTSPSEYDSEDIEAVRQEWPSAPTSPPSFRAQDYTRTPPRTVFTPPPPSPLPSPMLIDFIPRSPPTATVTVISPRPRNPRNLSSLPPVPRLSLPPPAAEFLTPPAPITLAIEPAPRPTTRPPPRKSNPQLKTISEAQSVTIQRIRRQKEEQKKKRTIRKKQAIKKFDCKVCNISATSAKNYSEHLTSRRHLNKIKNKNPFKCPDCNLDFHSLEDFARQNSSRNHRATVGRLQNS